MSSAEMSTILLAEPDAALRLAVQQALEKKGYLVVSAPNGKDALKKFTEEPSAIVVTSIPLPGRDGLDVLRVIKNAQPATEVILLADAQSIDSAVIGLNEGAFTYLIKPFEDLHLLLHTVGLAAHFQQLLQRSPPAREAMIQSSALEMIDHLLSRGTEDRLLQRTPQLPEPALPPRPREARETSFEVTASQVMRQILQFMRGNKALAKVFELLMQASVNLLDAPHAAVLLMTPTNGLQLYDARGYADIQAAGRNLLELVGEDFAWRVAKERRTIVDSKKGSNYLGTPLALKDEILGVLVVYPLKTRVPDPKRVEWLEAFAAQCAVAMELAKLQEEREKLSPNDAVSGALKRTVFFDLADREFRRCWRYDQPVSAIIVELNGMHDLKLQRGREFSDLVFHQVADACRRTVRQIDLIGRYDVDSFAVLLVMTNQEGARGAAERLSHAIDAILLPDNRSAVRVTASIGVSSYPREGCTSIFDLIQSADVAQKRPRSVGANQIYYG